MKSAENLGAWIANNPIIIIALAVLLTMASLNYAQQIEMQGMNTENFVGKESPLYQIYDHLFIERFGTESIAILVEGDDVTKPGVLQAMLGLSDQMKKAPGVLSAQSIADIVADATAASTGIREIPSSQEQIDAILASAGPQVQGMMPDTKHTLMSVEMPLTFSDRDRSDLLTETSAQVGFAHFPPDVGITVTGSPALSASIMGEMTASNGPLMALAGVLMVVALILTFRHVKWCLLPIPIVFLGIIWTFGAMGFLHIPMTMVSMSAFPVLIGIGIDYAIQFHNRIDEEFTKGEKPMQAVINTVNHVSVPVMIALIITAAGFFSMLTSSVPMIRDFGLLCLIGLFMCYHSALFVGTTVLYVVERRGSKRVRPAGQAAGDSNDTFIGDALEKTADFCIKRWQVVLSLALLLSLAGTYSDFQVPVETDFKTYIPQDLPPLVDFRHMSNIFGGTDKIDLIVQADDVTNPTTLKWMDQFSTYLEGSRAQVEGTTSIVTFIKAANGGVLPTDQTQAREIIDRLPSYARDRYLNGHDTALIDLNLGRAIDALGEEGIDRLLKEIDKDLAWNPAPPGVSVRESGDLVVMTTVIGALTTGRTEMTLLGLVLIFIILLIIYRDLIKALLPVLPMMVVIGWMGGVMYLGGLKYTPLTATLGALILGVGSEYAILMMERFYEELARVGDPDVALRITARRIGSALMASGLTTVFGFAALIASPFMITNNFGTVTVLAVIFALFTTFTVFVVLMLRMEMRRDALSAAKVRIMDAKRRMTN
ncbi:MAG TPA: RND family transporter [Methanotrichaceae archaeon]|nr:RND family transporter [Methanotrichaceae archaeon]